MDNPISQIYKCKVKIIACGIRQELVTTINTRSAEENDISKRKMDVLATGGSKSH